MPRTKATTSRKRSTVGSSKTTATRKSMESAKDCGKSNKTTRTHSTKSSTKACK